MMARRLSEAWKNGANGEVMVAIYNDVNPYVTEISLYNSFYTKINASLTSYNNTGYLYYPLGQLHSSKYGQDDGTGTDFFSLTYLPAKKILKTDLYADTTNYSDIQYE